VLQNKGEIQGQFPGIFIHTLHEIFTTLVQTVTEVSPFVLTPLSKVDREGE
jgi:hypothetical protein